MTEVTRDDVQRAVQEGVREIRYNMLRVKESVQRIDQRTNDLDNSQQHITELKRLQPVMEDFNRRSQLEFEHLRAISEDMKLRVQNIERGVQQITEYLQAQSQAVAEEKGYKRE